MHSAELAGVAVPQQNIFPRKRARLLRDVPICQQPNHGGHFDGSRSRVYLRMVDLFRLGHSLEHQDHGAAHGCNIDGLEGSVQNEDRLLHDGRLANGRRNPPRRARLASDFRRVLWPGRPTDLARWFHSPKSWSCNPASAAGYRGKALATVRPTTRAAPAPFRAREQASKVAPVVNTSSTSKTRSLSTGARSHGA